MHISRPGYGTHSGRDGDGWGDVHGPHRRHRRHVLIATVSSGILGWLVKLNFVEASITPGLVMADTGGSGDVSVPSAAGRMHLMPFAALTNRIGGALVLFVTSLLVPFYG